MPNFCTNCGSPINPSANFCGNCGARIIDTQAVDPVEAAARFEKYDSEGNTVEQLPNIDPVKPVEKRVSAEERIQREEESDWVSVKDSNDIAKLSSFLSNYGMYSRYASDCQKKIKQLEDLQKEAIRRQDEIIEEENHWLEIQTSDDITKFANHLTRYGNDCRHAIDCLKKINLIRPHEFVEEEIHWLEIRTSDDITKFAYHLTRYGNDCRHAIDCLKKINLIKATT